jgi:hypothetical protein
MTRTREAPTKQRNAARWQVYRQSSVFRYIRQRAESVDTGLIGAPDRQSPGTRPGFSSTKLSTSQLPISRLLGAADQDNFLADAGHVAFDQDVTWRVLRWLDKYQEPVSTR